MFTGSPAITPDRALGLPVLLALSLCTCCRHPPGAAAGHTASLIYPTVSAFPQSGRPAHRPFRGLLGVHSRYGLHIRLNAAASARGSPNTDNQRSTQRWAICRGIAVRLPPLIHETPPTKAGLPRLDRASGLVHWYKCEVPGCPLSDGYRVLSGHCPSGIERPRLMSAHLKLPSPRTILKAYRGEKLGTGEAKVAFRAEYESWKGTEDRAAG
jgi:hypothetical protein